MTQDLLLQSGLLVVFVGAFALCLSAIGFMVVRPLRGVLARGWLPSLGVIALVFLTLLAIVAIDTLFVPLGKALKTHHTHPAIAPLLLTFIASSGSAVVVFRLLRGTTRMPAADSKGFYSEAWVKKLRR